MGTNNYSRFTHAVFYYMKRRLLVELTTYKETLGVVLVVSFIRLTLTLSSHSVTLN
jgi:hypothetical protein